MSRFFLTTAALLGGIAVAAGAFGAHALEDAVTSERLATFETGVSYHMYHALALLAVAWMAAQGWGALVHWAGYCFLAGIVLFSGSLYVLVLTDTPWLGAVTPLGGAAFLAGWALMAWAALQGA